jgi:Tc toxin complex TcA C-terminal TcB-binding domain
VRLAGVSPPAGRTRAGEDVRMRRGELQITKEVSVAELDPAALAGLRRAGSCELSLTEELFDLDRPGEYLRRIKSIRVSVVSVTGPYIGARLALTLVKSAVRGAGDRRLTETVHETRIEASAGEDLRSPFAGAGAISDWRIELPPASGEFDTETITDVIVQLVYTARVGSRYGEPATD